MTKEEFVQYYTLIGASIDSDKYFETIINNSWKLNEGTVKPINDSKWKYEDPRKAETKQFTSNQPRGGYESQPTRTQDPKYPSSLVERARKATPAYPQE